MSIYLPDIEDTHGMLYAAHAALRDAGDKIHAVIVALHNAGRYADGRKEAAEVLPSLERARELIDDAMTAAGNGRSKLIHKTGCNGSCSGV